MDKKEALKTLINASMLSDSQKQELIDAVPDMTNEDIEELGKKIATQLIHSAESAKKALEAIDSLLEQVEKTEE